jgi:type I restriction enzyme S subunit
VDFDPVRAKAEGREPAGMDAETAALFPDSFEETEMGMVPSGWMITSFTEAIDVNPPRFLEKGITSPYLEMSNMPTNSARAMNVTSRDFSSGTKFKNGDVLIARITPCLENGKVVFVDFLEEGQIGWGSTEYIVTRSHPPLPLVYAYFLARFEDFRSFLITNMTGTSGRQRVPTSCLSGYDLVIPPEKICSRFSDILRPIMAAIKRHDEESQCLVALRNVLLPKLLSGGIRINEKY